MKITVISRPEAERYHPPENTIAISIYTPDYSIPVLSPDFVEHHTFCFFDRDVAIDELESGIITNEDAYKISQIIHRCMTNRMDVMIHCDAGISRSGAVAVAIDDYFRLGQDWSKKKPTFNRLVYNKVYTCLFYMDMIK